MALDALVDSAQLNSDLKDVADAIREKSGGIGSLAFPSGFVSEIEGLETYSIDDMAQNLQPSGDIVLSDSVTTLGDYAFCNKPITSIYAPAVTGMGAHALMNTKITQVTDSEFPVLGKSTAYMVLMSLPTTCTKIKLTGTRIQLHSGSYALRNNTGLVTAEFPNAAVNVGASYNHMGNYAFAGCTKLTLVDCGYVRSVSAYAFNGDTVLTTIILRYTDVAPLNNLTAFSGTPFASGGTGGTIYVPRDLISSYQTATNWSTLYGYGTVTFSAIEDSQYATHYADGTGVILG